MKPTKALLIANMLSDEGKEYSGSVVSFSSNSSEPLDNLVVNIEPIQDLHGYDNPWPAGGGKNLLKTAGLIEGAPSDTSFSNATKRTFTVGTFVTKLTNNNYYQTGINIQCLVSENSIKVTSSAKAYAISIPIVGLTIGETYVLSCTKTNANNNTASFYKQDGTFISNTQSLTICRFTVPEETYYTLLHFNPSENNVEATFTDIQLENGSVPSSYAPYSNICPISGRSEVNVYVEEAYDPQATPKATIQLGQTVYGGTVDVASGKLVITERLDDISDYSWVKDANRTGIFYTSNISGAKTAFPAVICSSYSVNNTKNANTISNGELSSYESYGGQRAFVKDEAKKDLNASEFASASAGIKLLIKLATPVEVTLTPTEVQMLIGKNNIWSNTGQISVRTPETSKDFLEFYLLTKGVKL